MKQVISWSRRGVVQLFATAPCMHLLASQGPRIRALRCSKPGRMPCLSANRMKRHHRVEGHCFCEEGTVIVTVSTSRIQPNLDHLSFHDGPRQTGSAATRLMLQLSWGCYPLSTSRTRRVHSPADEHIHWLRGAAWKIESAFLPRSTRSA